MLKLREGWKSNQKYNGENNRKGWHEYDDHSDKDDNVWGLFNGKYCKLIFEKKKNWITELSNFSTDTILDWLSSQFSDRTQTPTLAFLNPLNFTIIIKYLRFRLSTFKRLELYKILVLRFSINLLFSIILNSLFVSSWLENFEKLSVNRALLYECLKIQVYHSHVCFPHSKIHLIRLSIE